MSVGLIRSRFTNALRCYASYALRWLGTVRFSHMPMFVSVEPAALCQLHCPACPVGLSGEAGLSAKRSVSVTVRQRSGLIHRDLWERILPQIKDSAWVIQFYFQGEPLLNKDLPQMIREAHDAGLYTIVSTNAQAMTPSLANAFVAAGLNRIIISMDGLTQETYSAYRIGGSVEQVKRALHYLREAKDSLSFREGLGVGPSLPPFRGGSRGALIELQVLRLRSNEHEWEAFRREYKALGADRLVFKTAQLYDYRNGHPLMPTNPRYRRYEQHEDGLWYRKRLGKGCFRVWSGVVIAANGDVLPCCYDKDHAHAYGNLLTSTLTDLYTSSAAHAFRQQALHQTPEICKECWK